MAATRSGYQGPMRTTAHRSGTGRACAYEGWTVVELRSRAKQLGVSGYSGLNKEKLIWLLRSC